MRPLTLRVETEVDHHLLQSSTASHVNYIEEQVRHELASKLVRELVPMMAVHRYDHHADYKAVFVGEVIAMSWDNYAANYGTYAERRGISDGTMAIMQGGNWKIVGTSGPAPSPIHPIWHGNAPQPKKPAEPIKPKPFDPTEYLRNRVSELKNDPANN